MPNKERSTTRIFLIVPLLAEIRYFQAVRNQAFKRRGSLPVRHPHQMPMLGGKAPKRQRRKEGKVSAIMPAAGTPHRGASRGSLLIG